MHNSNEALRAAIRQELMTGLPAQHGREYMYRHMRSKRIPVANDRMFSIMKKLDPVGVMERTHDQKT
jgi:hypothetical protein